MDVAEHEPKERILELAKDRFFRSGFNKVTLDELSGELGISKKTMYKFFPSKEEMVKAVVWMMMHRVEKEVKRITEQDKPFTHRLADLIIFIGRTVGKLSKSFQQDMKRFAPVIWNEVERFRQEHIVGKVVAMIRRAKEEKVFREDINDEVIVLMVTTCFQNILTPDVLAEHAFSPKEALYTIFHVIFEGSLTEDARKEFVNYEITNL
ncbi:MAG: TetR/AcrR family transcriptional regulator [Bacteroidetes bacterium]|nr:TetR/AcrR family transcriptional regulator [Bacteroidota bacterium]